MYTFTGGRCTFCCVLARVLRARSGGNHTLYYFELFLFTAVQSGRSSLRNRLTVKSAWRFCGLDFIRSSRNQGERAAGAQQLMADFVGEIQEIEGAGRWIDFTLSFKNQGRRPPDPDFYRSIPNCMYTYIDDIGVQRCATGYMYCSTREHSAVLNGRTAHY